MFKKGNTNPMVGASENRSLANQIDAGTTVTGDIQTEGNIRIDGVLNGSVVAKGKVVVGEKGKINGEITCQNADVSGTLEAKIKVSELLSLRSTAKLVGEIETNKLSIDPGAIFSGTCSMGAVIKEMSSDQATSSNATTEEQVAQAQ